LWLQESYILIGCKGAVFIVAERELFSSWLQGSCLYLLWLQGGCIHRGCNGTVFIVAARELYPCWLQGSCKWTVSIEAARELYPLWQQGNWILSDWKDAVFIMTARGLY
jgi:hypothetical protein